jgi:hypothetical protein
MVQKKNTQHREEIMQKVVGTAGSLHRTIDRVYKKKSENRKDWICKKNNK